MYDMEMDMDIPMPEELELLEANSNLPEEDFEYFEPPEPFPDDEEDRTPPPEEVKHTTKQFVEVSDSFVDGNKKLESADRFFGTLVNGQKRARPDDEVILERLDDKRGRFEDAEADEDWLGYSELRESEEVNVADEGVNVVEEVVEEKEKKTKFISRFASEIEGEFFPVTGVDGDRVYARVCRSEVGGLEKIRAPARCRGGNFSSCLL